MAAVAHAGGSKGMYSWWWDSHISPKNSKWLQENLTDMDTKVQQMIKLIEEDADSFARRAEMYYKKRPELMKLVEEFYRAYRALAERYNHATGVIRHAHRTMSEAFPNQIPKVFDGDPPSGSSTEADLHTPPPAHALTEDANSTSSGKGLKQFNSLVRSGEGGNLSDERVRKGLNFQDAGEKHQSGHKGESNGKDRNISDSEQVSKTEAEILTLKKTLAELETERQAGLVQYQQSLDRLSNLESEVSRAQEESRRLSQRASKAESEVETLKEALTKLEAEKEDSLLKYQECVDKLSSLEKRLSLAQKDAEGVEEQANKARSEIEALRQDLVRVEADKDAAIAQHKQCLEKISVLEEQLKNAEENARMTNERADKAEAEIESLKQAMEKLIEEKERFAHQYQECLETVSSLELKLTCAEEEAKRLNSEIEDGVAKLKGAEEKYIILEKSNQTLHLELESMVLKVGAQSQELTEKQKELGRLWTCVQEERLRFLEAETAFQTLQHLHSQSQEELRSLAADLQTRSQLLREMQSHSQGLQEEVQKAKEENRSLSNLNHSSVQTIEDLQGEISRLRETIGKLEAEVELRVDQRNALQQEIYCLKEELNDLNKKNQNMLEQVESVGLNPDCFGLSVKEMQQENTMMKETSEKDRTQKLALLEKLEVMEKLTEKNSFLENSISDLNVELEEVRAKVKELEESCQSLLLEKSVLVSDKATLISQLQTTNENLDKLSEKNQLLENSLFDVNAEVDEMRVKYKSLEESYLLLNNQKSGLVAEREDFVSQLDIAQKSLEDLEGRCAQVNKKCIAIEEERNSTLQRLGELQTSLDAEKEEHARFSQSSQSQLASLELLIHLLREEGERKNKEYDEELDNAINSQIQIFILQHCVQDLKEKILSLMIEGNELLGNSKRLAEVISKLEKENVKQQHEVKSLSDQITLLRMGLYQVLVTVSADMKQGHQDKAQGDQNLLNYIIRNVKVMQDDISNLCEENQQFIIEKLILLTILDQIEAEAANILAERNSLSQEVMIQSEYLSAFQEEIKKLERVNAELRLEKMEEGEKKEALMIEVHDLSAQLSDLKGVYQQSQEENSQLTAEKRSHAEKISVLEQENHSIQEENCAMFGHQASSAILSLILKDVVSEKFKELKEVSRRLDSLLHVNGGLMEKLRLLEGEMGESKQGNVHLKALVKKLENELKFVKSLNNQLNFDIEKEKNLTCQKENELLRAKDVIRVMQSEIKEMEGSFEEQAEAIVGDLQTSAVQEALFREKFYELAKACHNLEAGNGVKSSEIDLLKKRINNLESENGGFSARLAAYIPVVDSLRDCVASLEEHTIHRKRLEEMGKTEIKDSDKAEDPEKKSEYSNNTVVCGTLELQDLQSRLKAIEMAVLEMDKLSFQEVSVANNKREAMTREIEDLKYESKLFAKRKKEKTEYKHSSDENLQEHLSVTTETGNEVLTKDIMLDHVSDCSSYGKSRRENMETVAQLIECWDTSDQDGNIDMRVGNAKNAVPCSRFHPDEAGRKHKDRRSSSDLVVYKELSVDGLESKRYSEPNQEGNRRKILERLDSDAQKLTNLQITVQDLKRKVDITEKGKRVLEFDYDGVKGQLEEADDGIKKLFDVNHKLIKNVETVSTPTEGKSAIELNRDRSIRRRRISEQARRASEKIGRLQLEVQKIQFLLLKHDDEKGSKGKIRIGGRSRRVLLRDYLYGGSRAAHKKKKATFCSCVQPPTRGD